MSLGLLKSYNPFCDAIAIILFFCLVDAMPGIISFSGNFVSIPISDASYNPCKSSGNASLNAVTIAHFLIITQGICFHVDCPLLYSSILTVDLIGNFISFTYTSHHPPINFSFIPFNAPSLSIMFPSLSIVTIPAFIPSNLGFLYALLTNTSLPTTIFAGLLPNLIRYASLMNGFNFCALHNSINIIVSWSVMFPLPLTK